MAYQDELEVGAEIARKAGDLALRIRQGGIHVEIKSDESPVTIADRECERLIVAELQRAFPEDGLLGEEGASRESSNGRRWIIDPIDGTRDFIRGTGAWSVLIGLEEQDGAEQDGAEQGSVVAGFAYFPATGTMYSAARGHGAFRDKTRIAASAVTTKSEALLCVNGLSYMHRYAFAPKLVDWISGFWTVRSMGGCLDAMLVASGVADAWMEAQAKPWDLAPLKIIAEEAGCVAFDFAGKDTIYGGNYVIATPGVADELRQFLTRDHHTDPHPY
jgi:histidinol-phosphatase